MAEQQIRELKQKLAEREAEFENYKAECKQLQVLLQSQSNKKEEQIRKLKQQAILRQKANNPLKGQVAQLQTENAKLKDQLNELKQQLASAQSSSQKAEALAKENEQLQKKIAQLTQQRDSQQSKISSLQSKLEGNPKNKGSGGSADSKKLEEALSSGKSKIAELERQNEKLRQQLSKKQSAKDVKNDEKKVEKDHDNKEQQRLKEKVDKLEKRLSESQSEVSKFEQKSNKLSKQVKQLKEKLSYAESEKEGLHKKVKQLSIANSYRKQQAVRQNVEEAESQGYIEESKDQSITAITSTPVYSALVLTKKHYASPFLEFKNDNSVKLYKSTKNGCFEKSLGCLKYKLNEISYNQEQIIEGCAKRIKDNINSGIKNSIVLFGSKKTTKKYILASLVSQLKDFIMQKIGQSEEQAEVFFVKASPEPENRFELTGHSGEEIEQILDHVIELAKKSAKKPDSKKKQPRPKARYLKITQGQLYVQIITTSFTNIYLRENLSAAQALNNIAYSRLPNALQPTNCFRQFIFTLNPIVSLYDDCKNTLSIINCKRQTDCDSLPEQEIKNSPNKDELNDMARRKLQSIEREGEQSQLKIRKQDEQILFYRTKFDELELRLKNLLNTHRQQNSYLKKSPVTLSYEKMLKFVHSVQAKNSSFSNSFGSASKVQQINYGEEGENEHENDDNDGGEGEGEDIL